MKEILQFICEHLMFMFTSFRLVDSKVFSEARTEGYVTLEAENCRIRIFRERLKLFIEFQSSHGPRDRWYDWDIVQEMALNQPVEASLLDSASAVQLKKILPALDNAFSVPKRESTEKSLDELERKRAKRLFGV